MVPGLSGPRFGRLFLVGKFNIFGLCSWSCRSFAVSFCPVESNIIWIQMMNGRASRKFVGKSSSELKVSTMVVQIQNFGENSWFYWNPVKHEISSRNQFPEGLRPQNPPGSCAARNVQNFGVTTCSIHAWCLYEWWWWFVSLICCWTTWFHFSTWLVETGL